MSAWLLNVVAYDVSGRRRVIFLRPNDASSISRRYGDSPKPPMRKMFCSKLDMA